MVEEDIIQFFTLSAADLTLTRRRRGDANRLGFALQLCSLRFLGFVPSTLSGVDHDALIFLSGQLGVRPNALRQYASRSQTASDHLLEAAAHLSFRAMSPRDRSQLQKWLYDRAMEHDRPSSLLEQACEWLHSRKIMRPTGISTIEKMVTKSRHEASVRTYKLLSSVLSPSVRAFLDRLLAVKSGSKLTRVQWLNDREVTNDTNAILAMLERYSYLKSHGVHSWNLSEINPNRRKLLAAIGRRSSAQALRTRRDESRYSILACMIWETSEDITDDILEMFDRNLASLHSCAQRELREYRSLIGTSTDKKIRMLEMIGRIVLNHGIRDQKVRSTIFSNIEKEELQKAVLECRDLARPDGNVVWDFFSARYAHIRKFSRLFIEQMRFENRPHLNGLMKAISNIRLIDRGHSRSLPRNTPTDFVDRTWAPYVNNGRGQIQRPAYELCALWTLRLSLRCGDVWSSHSKRYSNPDNWLISKESWPSLRDEYLSMVRFPKTWIAKRTLCCNEYTAGIEGLCRELQRGTDIRLEEDELVVSPIEAEEIPESVLRLQEEIASRIPEVQLTEILMETDSWIQYSDCFKHSGNEDTRLHDHQKRATVIIFQLACNLEQERVARHAGLSQDQLRWFAKWFIREESIQEAIDCVVNAQYQNPFSHVFGSGMLSSSDGQRFPVSVKTRNAVAIPRYFGHGRGVTFYSWTSSQFSQYGVRVIPSTMRDATYVFDAILDNETDLPILEHTTDTAGHSALVFALADLLGIKFSPRLKDIASKKLLRLNGVAEYGEAAVLFKRSNRFRDSLVARHWDEILRIGASIKMGYVTASMEISRLQSFPRKSGVVSALIEYGRLQMTLFIMSYLNQPKYRRYIGKQLNKGESVHTLRSFVAFGNEGKIRLSHLESQINQAGCLTLVTNLIVLWNTRYIEKIVDTLRSEGWSISDEDLSHISPCRFEHIERYGKFSFDSKSVPKTGCMRRLRNTKNNP